MRFGVPYGELATSTKKTITCAWLTQTSALDACSVFPRALTLPLDCSGTTKISILRNATSALIRRLREHEVGPDGVRACESVCPERAIKFVKELPKETGGSQYDVDLRTGTSWPSMMTYAVGATGNPGSEGSSAKK